MEGKVADPWSDGLPSRPAWRSHSMLRHCHPESTAALVQRFPVGACRRSLATAYGRLATICALALVLASCSRAPGARASSEAPQPESVTSVSVHHWVAEFEARRDRVIVFAGDDRASLAEWKDVLEHRGLGAPSLDHAQRFHATDLGGVIERDPNLHAGRVLWAPGAEVADPDEGGDARYVVEEVTHDFTRGDEDRSIAGQQTEHWQLVVRARQRARDDLPGEGHGPPPTPVLLEEMRLDGWFVPELPFSPLVLWMPVWGMNFHDCGDCLAALDALPAGQHAGHLTVLFTERGMLAAAHVSHDQVGGESFDGLAERLQPVDERHVRHFELKSLERREGPAVTPEALAAFPVLDDARYVHLRNLSQSIFSLESIASMTSPRGEGRLEAELHGVDAAAALAGDVFTREVHTPGGGTAHAILIRGMAFGGERSVWLMATVPGGNRPARGTYALHAVQPPRDFIREGYAVPESAEDFVAGVIAGVFVNGRAAYLVASEGTLEITESTDDALAGRLHATLDGWATFGGAHPRTGVVEAEFSASFAEE